MTSHDKSTAPRSVEELTQHLEAALLEKHGPLLSNDELRIALGYSSMDAFRQGLVRKTVPVPVFSIEGRRGKYALVKDVANWLAKQRTAAVEQLHAEEKP